MNIALILAAGVGQRMRSAGLPKQFLKLFGKPIIIYTLEKFESCPEIDAVVIVCRDGYIDYMNQLLTDYRIKKCSKVIVGGNDRQSSLKKGLEAVSSVSSQPDDIVVIHDGVRPMVSLSTIQENIRVAKEYGCAITVRPVTESVVITDLDTAAIKDFKKRKDTYSLTAPQSFQLERLQKTYLLSKEIEECEGVPLLDAGMLYASRGGEVHLVKEQGNNIKITTPEDFYYLKSMIELEENKSIFGI